MPTITDIFNKIGTRKRVSDALYLTLKKAIITGLILPFEKIDEYKISEELHVSIASIKEAIKMLDMEKYMIFDNKKGYIVNEISLSNVIKIHEYLQILSIASIEAISVNHDVFCILLQESLKNHHDKSKNNMDKQFHMTMALCTHNNYIIKATEDGFDRLFWGKKILELNNISDEILADHENIVKYLTENKINEHSKSKNLIMKHFNMHLNDLYEKI